MRIMCDRVCAMCENWVFLKVVHGLSISMYLSYETSKMANGKNVVFKEIFKFVCVYWFTKMVDVIDPVEKNFMDK